MISTHQGLPVRNLFCYVEGEPREIFISTSIVNDMIDELEKALDKNHELIRAIRRFDDSVMYFVPYSVFSFDSDKAVLNYIHQHIDSLVTNPE